MEFDTAFPTINTLPSLDYEHTFKACQGLLKSLWVSLEAFQKQFSHFVVAISHLNYETFIAEINKREKEKYCLSSKLDLNLYHSFSLYVVPHV